MGQTETPAPGEAPIMCPVGAGDPASTFMLPDPDDVMISSAKLLENGPLVVTFYRRCSQRREAVQAGCRTSAILDTRD